MVENPKQAHFESDAILGIARELELLPPVVRGLTKVVQGGTPKLVRDQAYHIIAKNRYLFGVKDGPTCRLDFDGEFDKCFVDDPVDIE